MNSAKIVKTIVNTPGNLSSFITQRKWEKRVLLRGTTPANVKFSRWVADWPFGKIVFGIVATMFFGVDALAGAITGYDVAAQQIKGAQKDHAELSKKKLEEANKMLAAKMEVLDMTRKAKETGWHTTAVHQA
jgi:hypothetical protein